MSDLSEDPPKNRKFAILAGAVAMEDYYRGGGDRGQEALRQAIVAFLRKRAQHTRDADLRNHLEAERRVLEVADLRFGVVGDRC